MALYSLEQETLHRLKEESFAVEKDIQTITEQNLETIFGLQCVKSEFALHDLRLDTLAFNQETQSFVIIEYKNTKNFSVIDQGYAYLSLLLNNKADFILEYNEKTNTSLRKEDVDWSQSKILFISPSFSHYQQKAIGFKDLPIELWEVFKYQNNVLQYTQVKSPDNSESISTISKSNQTINSVNNEVKVYTETDHLSTTSPNIASLYTELREYVMNLDGHIHILPRKHYLTFAVSSPFLDLVIKKKSLTCYLHIPKDTISDIHNMVRDVSDIGHWGTGSSECKITSTQDLLRIKPLIQESYLANT